MRRLTDRAHVEKTSTLAERHDKAAIKDVRELEARAHGGAVLEVPENAFDDSDLARNLEHRENGCPDGAPELVWVMLGWVCVGWSGVEWSGVEWSGVEWSGVEWS
jgi:hypothetical protein